jgi:hypothetical protein
VKCGLKALISTRCTFFDRNKDIDKHTAVRDKEQESGTDRVWIPALGILLDFFQPALARAHIIWAELAGGCADTIWVLAFGLASLTLKLKAGAGESLAR